MYEDSRSRGEKVESPLTKRDQIRNSKLRWDDECSLSGTGLEIRDAVVLILGSG